MIRGVAQAPDPVAARRRLVVLDVVLLCAVTALLVWGAFRQRGSLDLSVAAPTMAAYVVGALVVGALLVVASRWLPGRGWREWVESRHPVVVALLGVMGLVGIPVYSVPFAEAVACSRDDGVVVRTTLTGAGDVKTGSYEVDGETYELRLKADQVESRQVEPLEVGEGSTPTRTRTYRVPWAGSAHVCGTSLDTDRGNIGGTTFIGVVMGLWVSGAVALLARRRRRR